MDNNISEAAKSTVPIVVRDCLACEFDGHRELLVRNPCPDDIVGVLISRKCQELQASIITL